MLMLGYFKVSYKGLQPRFIFVCRTSERAVLGSIVNWDSCRYVLDMSRLGLCLTIIGVYYCRWSSAAESLARQSLVPAVQS